MGHASAVHESGFHCRSSRSALANGQFTPGRDILRLPPIAQPHPDTVIIPAVAERYAEYRESPAVLHRDMRMKSVARHGLRPPARGGESRAVATGLTALCSVSGTTTIPVHSSGHPEGGVF